MECHYINMDFKIENQYYYECLPSHPVNGVKLQIMWTIQLVFLVVYACIFILLQRIGGKQLKYNMISLLIVTLVMQTLYVVVIGVLEYIVPRKVFWRVEKGDETIGQTRYYSLMQSLI